MNERVTCDTIEKRNRFSKMSRNTNLLLRMFRGILNNLRSLFSTKEKENR